MDAAICIGCGACVAACPNGSGMLFTGAKVTHLNLLPQGEPERHHRARSMVRQHDDEGFGACTNTGECQQVCPQNISIKVIGELNREYRRRDDPQAPRARRARSKPSNPRFQAQTSDLTPRRRIKSAAADASSRRTRHRSRARRAARRARGCPDRRVRRDHLEGPPRALALERRAGRDQRRAQPRRLVGVARLRHDQGLRLPGRPGRDRDHVPRGARGDHPPRAPRGPLPPRRRGQASAPARSAAPRPRAPTTSPTSPARRSCTSSTSS